MRIYFGRILDFSVLCGVALCVLMTVQSILQIQQLLTSRNSEHADIMTRLSLEASSLLKTRFFATLMCKVCEYTKKCYGSHK